MDVIVVVNVVSEASLGCRAWGDEEELIFCAIEQAEIRGRSEV